MTPGAWILLVLSALYAPPVISAAMDWPCVACAILSFVVWWTFALVVTVAASLWLRTLEPDE